MRILAIDPGTELSAFVVYDTAARVVLEKGIVPNEEMLHVVGASDEDLMAIEMVAAMGMSVGAEVFETVLWTGRFIQARVPLPYRKVKRHEVKMHLCGTMRAKDPNIRRALLDLFPRTGGGKTPQVGIQSKPGPLFGVVEDIWSALGVAITAAELAGRAA